MTLTDLQGYFIYCKPFTVCSFLYNCAALYYCRRRAMCLQVMFLVLTAKGL